MSTNLIKLVSDTIINIHGGNNQILPNATEAVQNFYGTQPVETKSERPLPTLPEDYLALEASRLIPYLNNRESLDGYLTQLQECRSAIELARIILDMQEREARITQEEIVKERFIKLFLPLGNFTVGKTVGNIRARINDALANRPKYSPLKDNSPSGFHGK